MITEIFYLEKKYAIDLSKPIDISMPLAASPNNVTAWYVAPPKIEPVVGDGFIGDVNKGGSVNFRDIQFNPHGHGTHTECVGHISRENYSINQCLTQFFFLTNVVSIAPEKMDNDLMITAKQMEDAFIHNGAKAIVLRTLPNEENKKSKQYSNTNPPFITSEAVTFLIKNGIDHLLIDTPSVDKEKDNGALLAHHAFWEYPHNTQSHRTISELIYVPSTIADGTYWLNLQIASFENDASPSKPILYAIKK